MVLLKEIAENDKLYDSHVLVGRSITNHLLKKSGKKGKMRVQFIISNDNETEIDIIRKMLSKHLHGTKMSFVSYSANIPTFPKLSYFTLYVGEDPRVPIADFFDCATYNVYPSMIYDYDGHIIRAGTHPVLLLFCIVNMWIMKMQISISIQNGKTDNRFEEDVISGYIGDYIDVSKDMDNQDLEDTFPIDPEKYVGTYIDEGVANRKNTWEKKQNTVYYPPSYPALKTVTE
jgi:hypothetical protein